MYKQKHRSSHIHDKQKLNPFQKSNPYRIKAKFYSQKKDSNHIEKTSTNPQTHKYKRNYNHYPAIYQSSGMKQSITSIKHVKRMLMLDQPFDINRKLYDMDYKQFVMGKFCPSDAYLEIVKDKFAIVNGCKSQFQNLIRMSNISISKFSTTKDNYTSSSSYSGKMKQNPFLRKNLIMLNADRPSGSVSHGFDTFVYDNYLYDNNEYRTTIVNNSLTVQHDYQDFYEPTMKYKKSSYESVPTVNMSKRASSGSQKDGRRSSPREQHQNMQCSFGHKNGHQKRKILSNLLDAIVQNAIQDPLKIQEKAPKQVKIKGMTFYLSKIQRLPQ